GDAEVTGQCQLEAAAQRDAVDRGDDRTRDLPDGVERGPEPPADGTRLVRPSELADVRSGGEGLRAAEQDDRLHARFLAELGGGGRELVAQRAGHRVERRAAPARGGDAVAAPIDGDVPRHAPPPCRDLAYAPRANTPSPPMGRNPADSS